MLLFVLVLIISLANAEERKGMYTITASNTILSRSYYTVQAFIHQAPRPVNITVELHKLPTSSNAINFDPLTEVIRPGEGKTFRFKTKALTSEAYILVVTGRNGIEFDEQTTVTVNQKKASTFIQTDKAIYQAGQQVNFRIVNISPKLLPVNAPLSVYIYDRQGNKVKQWINQTTFRGIFSSSLQLSDKPMLGEWKLEVDNSGGIISQNFLVEEYALPTFEVTITSQPAFVTYANSDLVISVAAKYTFGHSVKGRLSITIFDEYCSYSFVTHCDSRNHSVTDLQITGEHTFSSNLVNDLVLPENVYTAGFRNFKILAVVTEDVTGKRENATATIPLHKESIKMEFLPAGSFKPGLPFNQLLKVSYQDDTPVVDPNGTVTVITSFGYATSSPISSNRTIPATGILKLNFYVPRKAVSLTFQAEYRGVTGFGTASKAATSGNYEYIKILQMTENPSVFNPIHLEITATQHIEYKIILEVVSRSDIVYVKTFPPSQRRSQKIGFIVQDVMAPSMTVVVYYVTSCGNLIVDALSILVDGLFRNPVSVNLTPNNTLPGSDFVVDVHTKPRSFVGLLGIDQSVLIYKSTNDISKQKVLDDIRGYDVSGYYFYNPNIVQGAVGSNQAWASGQTTLQVFRDAGLLVFANYVEEIETLPGPFSGLGLDKSMTNDDSIDFEGIQVIGDNTIDHGDATKTRKSFPETFMWLEGEADAGGTFSTKGIAPDAITSYIFSAIAMEETYGFGVTSAIAKLTIFKQFFVSFVLPYSVIKDETIEIRVTIFNYLQAPVRATVSLNNENDQFSIIGQNGKEIKDKFLESILEVPAQDSILTTFLISPKVLGFITVKIAAACREARDVSIKKLFVKAEGIKRNEHRTYFADLSKSSNHLALDIPIKFPVDTVQGSEEVVLTVTGTIFEKITTNLNKLISQPADSGEPNMLHFVPDLVVVEYYRAIGEANKDAYFKSLSYMEKSYQKELTYRHNDGSFSAFGNSDSSGSTWLTAMVAKYFHRAESYITVDQKVVSGCLDFLTTQQSSDGSFIDSGSVIHTKIQGMSNGLSLAAYVATAFLEVNLPGYKPVVDKIIHYIESQEPLLSTLKPFELILCTYALHLAADSTKREEFLSAAAMNAFTEENKMYWGVQVQPQIGEQHNNAEASNSNVETTAYMLMIYLLRNDTEKALPIVRWLVSQQNPNGGFGSTQDTIAGIEALSRAANRLLNKPDATVTVTATAGDMKKTISLNQSNFAIQQKEYLPTNTSLVHIILVGNGIVIFEVHWSYNEKNVEAPINSAFEVRAKAETTTVSNTSFVVEACARNPLGKPSGLAIMEIGFTSGCTVDPNSLPKIDAVKKIKNVVTKNGSTRVLIYFESINEDVCVTISASQTFLVTNLRPAIVKVYDYYRPTISGEASYTVPDRTFD